MNKTVREHLQDFVRWFGLSLLAVSGLANLVFWFYIGKAFWYHEAHYLWVASFWFAVSIPSSAARVYVTIQDRKDRRY